MARNRIIKAAAFRSRDLCRVPIPARWTFAGLWTLADDKGRYEDDTEAICADLYLRDREITPDVVEDHLAMLAEAGLICRYTVGKRAYLHMPTWDKHQRVDHPSPHRCPACPRDHSDDEGTLFPSNQWESHRGLSEASCNPRDEEERREENKTLVPHDAETASWGTADPMTDVTTEANGTTRTRLPPDFRPTPQSVANVKRHRPDVDWQAETRRFRAYWEAKVGKDAEHADWQQTWRNWMRRARGAKGPPDDFQRTGGMNWG